MDNNAQLIKDVQDAIQWKPLLSNESINVTAQNGIVSLTGIVDSYVKKVDAERSASKVAGVNGLVGNLEVVFPSNFYKTNIELAQESIAFLNASDTVPQDKIKVKVEDGWVTLNGEVHGILEKNAAFEAIHYISGIKGITNNIIIVSQEIEDSTPHFLT
jgi:osmotically-inducible protein OsmY